MKESEMKPGVYVRVIDTSWVRDNFRDKIGKVFMITSDNIKPASSSIQIEGIESKKYVVLKDRENCWWDDLELVSKEEAALLKLKL